MASEDARGRRTHSPFSTDVYQSNTHPIITPLNSQSRIITPPNVVIFGETGTGKSSIINMLADDEVAVTSNSVRGCTFDSKPYSILVRGHNYKIWDTAGLNEGEEGTVPADRAWKNLRNLVYGLEGGLNLLVYCIRGGRYRDIIKFNYDLFWTIICQSKVPIVLVITGLENEERGLYSWWDRNQSEFTIRDIKFDGIACITSCRGKILGNGRPAFEKEYNESIEVLRNLIEEHCASRAWVVAEHKGWLRQIKRNLSNYCDPFNPRKGTERRISKLGTLIMQWMRGLGGQMD